MLKVLIFCISLCICPFSVTCGLVKEEQSCEWLGLKGKCVPPRVCLTSLDERGDQPPACPNKGAEATICCTDCELVNDTSNFIISPSIGTFWKDGRKSRDACLQYLKDLPHSCGQEGYYSGISRELNVERKCHVFSIWGVGGAPPRGYEPPSENPYEAILGFGENLETAIWTASGAIISDKFVLTSAKEHTTTSGTAPLKYAALGVKNRKSDMKTWQIHTVKKIYLHPEFDQGNNNIALLELAEPIAFNYKVLPACLPDPTEEFDITTAKFSSWKDKSNSESFLDTPQILHVEELTANECHVKITNPKSPDSFTYVPEKIKTESQLCYGNENTCLNVIGGPLTVTTQYSRCMNTVIGVKDYGDGCGPTVFTKVQHYTPWIESIVWP